MHFGDAALRSDEELPPAVRHPDLHPMSNKLLHGQRAARGSGVSGRGAAARTGILAWKSAAARLINAGDKAAAARPRKASANGAGGCPSSADGKGAGGRARDAQLGVRNPRLKAAGARRG